MTHPHPLADFVYCPHCGSSRFVENNPFSKRCAACGFVFYPDAAAATAAFVLNPQGELLCARRANDPAKGTLDLPGGFVDPGESLTDGLKRELHEELGAEVADYEFLFSFPNTYPYSGHIVHTADAFFLCRLTDYGGLKPCDDVAELLWKPVAEVSPADFGLVSVRRAVERFKELQAANVGKS